MGIANNKTGHPKKKVLFMSKIHCFLYFLTWSWDKNRKKVLITAGTLVSRICRTACKPKLLLNYLELRRRTGPHSCDHGNWAEREPWSSRERRSRPSPCPRCRLRRREPRLQDCYLMTWLHCWLLTEQQKCREDVEITKLQRWPTILSWIG